MKGGKERGKERGRGGSRKEGELRDGGGVEEWSGVWGGRRKGVVAGWMKGGKGRRRRWEYINITYN